MAEKKLSLSNFLKKIVTRKSPDEALAGAKEGGLEKTLGVWDLIILGVGAKIFSVAGPVILFSTLSGTVFGIIYYFYLMVFK